MRKHFPLLIACIVVCAGLLAACDKGPDTEKTKLELVTKTEPEGETVEESKKKLPEVSKEETKPEEQTESSYNAREARTRMLSERVLVLFANQCLDLYYSDFQLMEYETVDNKSGISVAPGSSLYYRIDSYAYDDIYQITYSSDESFTRSGSVIYRYDKDADRFWETDSVHNTLLKVSSGEMVIPDEIIDTDEQRKQDIRDAFREFWKNWQASDVVKDYWPINVKNAYLMPFSVDEFGNAELSFFLEQEDGVWMMGRARANANPYYDEAFEYQPGLFIEWKTNYERLNYASNPSFLIWLQYYRDFGYLNIEKNPYFDRFYCPDSSGGYTVNDYAGVGYTNITELRGAPSDGSFIASVPELALEKLPLADSLTKVPASESGVKEEILSYDYDEILDRLMVQMKNRCLEWYYSGVSFPTNDGEIKPKPGDTVKYDVYLHRPSMTFRIQCYEGEECPVEWLYRSPGVYSENYIYSIRDDSLVRYPGFLPIDDKISSGSFTIPNTFEAGTDPKAPEYTFMMDGIHAIWNDFKYWYDDWVGAVGWPETEGTEEFYSRYPGMSYDFMYCDRIANAYLMPFSVGEDRSFEAYILIEMQNGNWFQMQVSIPSPMLFTAQDDYDFSTVLLMDTQVMYLYGVDSDTLLSIKEKYNSAIPFEYYQINEEYLAKIPELALEKLY